MVSETEKLKLEIVAEMMVGEARYRQATQNFQDFNSALYSVLMDVHTSLDGKWEVPPSASLYTDESE